MHILPNPAAPADQPAPLPFVIVPRDLGGRAAALSRGGHVLYIDPSASRDDLLRAIRETAVYLATGDPGSARVNRPRLHVVPAVAE